tara:strand:- start:538 stop:864 length:327 start_codon:yes stop_codon:yes gene_type:complete
MLYKLWNKRTLYEIYFRPLISVSSPNDILSKVEIVTFFSGEPYMNPWTKREDNKGNTEVWDVGDARAAWDDRINNDGYEVSEVEDYLKNDTQGQSTNYLKGKSNANNV